jgi:hypothetical protein
MYDILEFRRATIRDSVAVTVLIRIWKALGSNIGRDAWYLDRPSVGFLCLSKQMPGYYVDFASTDSFQILSISLIILSFCGIQSSYGQHRKITHGSTKW